MFPRHAEMVQPVSMVSTHTHVPVVLVSLIADVLQVSTVPQSKNAVCADYMHTTSFYLLKREKIGWWAQVEKERKRGVYSGER